VSGGVAAPAAALIGFGQVRHTRTRPQTNAFAYPTHFLMLPMRALRTHGPGALARNRWASLAFYDRDHGDGGPDALAWIEGLLAQQGVHGVDGEIWLHTYPRVWGYTFKPVSFWHCHRADGSLAAIVAEVNNTFGERHCYLLPEPHYGQVLTASKHLHVSPFCPVQGHYRFVFMRSERTGAPRLVARIDYHDEADAEAIVRTSVSGELLALNAATQRRATWRHPLMTLAVIARIHWQALRLWTKKTPFFRQPAAPAHAVSVGKASVR
jgi:uncharacterized protein